MRSNTGKLSPRSTVVILAACLIVGLIAGILIGSRFWTRDKTAVSRNPGSTPIRSTTPRHSQPLPFDALRAQQTIGYISSSIGTRVEGQPAERQAAEYLAAELAKLGYGVTRQQFTLPDGTISENVVTSDPGQSSNVFIIGAHVDTVADTPGANDNASGCSMVLELARDLKGTKHYPEIRFIIFGAEEYYKGNKNIDHQGSGYYVKQLSPEERSRIVGMLSCDTVASGSEIRFREHGPISPRLAVALVDAGHASGLNVNHSPSSISDHRAFGDAGVPAVWVERADPGDNFDPAVHKPGDTLGHAESNLLGQVGSFIESYLLKLDESQCRFLITGIATAAPTVPGTVRSSP